MPGPPRPVPRRPPGSVRRPQGRRAVSPVVGVVLLLVLTVALAAVVTAAGLGAVGVVPDVGGRADLSLAVDAEADRLTLRHRAGEPLDVGRLTVRVRVAGTPLRHQPPVPFFAAQGFRSGPTGPFNAAADPRWTAGEVASLRLASTNGPTIAPGDRVVVDVTVGGRRVATLAARA